jgi:hypothetical protein
MGKSIIEIGLLLDSYLTCLYFGNPLTLSFTLD